MLEVQIHLIHLDHIRTTLVIDDDVYQAAAHDAKLRGQTISHYITDVLRHRYPVARVEVSDDGLPVIITQPGSPVITSEDIKKTKEQEDMERYARHFARR